MNYYPVYLNLSGKRAVVAGGGPVAERKVLSLIAAGASVTVISPALTKGLREMKSKGSITHRGRAYRKGDVRGAFLVIAATDSEETNRLIASEASGLVNVVDVPKLCNFIAPSVVRRGSFVIAVSTSGVSPALSKSIRKELQSLYGNDIARYLEFTKKIRAKAMKMIGDQRKREAFLKVLGSPKVLTALREEGLSEVRDAVTRQLARIIQKETGRK